MDENEKSQLIAEAENVEAIRDFFVEWYDLESLYEAEAKAAIVALHLVENKMICEDDAKALSDVLNQHMMMVEHMKPFAARKEEEA